MQQQGTEEGGEEATFERKYAVTRTRLHSNLAQRSMREFSVCTQDAQAKIRELEAQVEKWKNKAASYANAAAVSALADTCHPPHLEGSQEPRLCQVYWS